MNKKVVIIDLVLLLIAFGFFFICLNQDSIIFSIIGLIVVIIALLYVVYSFYIMFSYKETLEDKLKSVNKKHVFDNQVYLLNKQNERLLSREKIILEDSNSNIVNAYNIIKEKVLANIDTSVNFMNSYDYVTRPEPKYLNELLAENDKMLNKLNTLIELNLKVDNTTVTDTERIDDLIKSLEEISNEQ